MLLSNTRELACTVLRTTGSWSRLNRCRPAHWACMRGMACMHTREGFGCRCHACRDEANACIRQLGERPAVRLTVDGRGTRTSASRQQPCTSFNGRLYWSGRTRYGLQRARGSRLGALLTSMPSSRWSASLQESQPQDDFVLAVTSSFQQSQSLQEAM